MEELQEYVQQYYDAIYDDTIDEEQSFSIIPELILFLLLFYGRNHLKDLVSDLGEIPETISYTPKVEDIDRGSDDLKRVLTGLSVRVGELIVAKQVLFPNMDVAEVKTLVHSENQYQVTRIVESQDHSISNIAEVSIVKSLIEHTGVSLTKTWVAKMDSTTCEICATMNGVTIPFNERFEYANDTITLDSHYSDCANAHPHCRCQIKYNLERR
ncbi:MAG: phage minor head protein [Paracoccus sp. (in: a-proteobacteria)]